MPFEIIKVIVSFCKTSILPCCSCITFICSSVNFETSFFGGIFGLIIPFPIGGKGTLPFSKRFISILSISAIFRSPCSLVIMPFKIIKAIVSFCKVIILICWSSIIFFCASVRFGTSILGIRFGF